MRCFGNRLEAQCNKCSLVLQKLDPRLEFQHPLSASPRYRFRNSHELPCNTPIACSCRDCNLPDVNAGAPDICVCTAYQLIALMRDYQALLLRLRTKVVFCHAYE